MKRRHGDPGELNLLPVMNLVTILVPLLLLGAELAHLGILESQVPAIGDDGPPAPLQLTVAISRVGFTLLGAAGAEALPVPQEDLVLPCTDARCAAPERYDYEGLQVQLARIKDAYPDEEAITLLPDADISYQVLISTMDATRIDGDRPLFPRVVIAGGGSG